MSKQKYQVITPAGIIYCETAEQAAEYKKLYGYPSRRQTNNDPSCDNNGPTGHGDECYSDADTGL